MNLFLKLIRIIKNHGIHFPLAVYGKAMSIRRASLSKRYWKNLKDIHKGQRGFVIGNGPSLQMKDLDRLKEEVTIASNKIYLAFKLTEWRPTYFTVCDDLVWEKIKNEVHEFIPLVHAASRVPRAPSTLRNKLQYWEFLSNNPELTNNFSSDLSKGAFGGGTVTFENLQIAVHLGLNPIYIIGCDHFYSGEDQVNKEKAMLAPEENNHFIKGYRRAGEKVNPAPIGVMERSYSAAQKFAQTNGIKIYNATRGGHLEAFDRVNFDDLF